MYGRGHEQGTKKVSRSSQAWYDKIAEENLAKVEAEDAARALATALAQQVGAAVTALPQAASRIAKAATLVQTQQIWPLSDGTFLVGSDSDTVNAYLVRRQGWTCDCADHAYRGWYCKHALAAMMTVKVGAAYHANYDLPQAA